MKKAYVLNLSFGTWKNQIWFMGGDDAAHSEAFEKAKKSLPSATSDCLNSNDFFHRACSHFENLGFLRIQK